MEEEELNALTQQILGCAYKVHTGLGPGLLESAYEECLYYEMHKAGLKVKRQIDIPLSYEEVKLSVGFRLDLIVEDKVIVEVKAIEAFKDIHTAQVLTYLKLTNCKVGLLINFNVPSLKLGIKRLIR
jgi:GxxExxY protein